MNTRQMENCLFMAVVVIGGYLAADIFYRMMTGTFRMRSPVEPSMIFVSMWWAVPIVGAFMAFVNWGYEKLSDSDGAEKC